MFFIFSVFEKDTLCEKSDIEIRGFLADPKKSYICYSSRTRRKEETFIYVYKGIKWQDADHFTIHFTHQTSSGQSGGPVIWRHDGKIEIIGMNVIGRTVLHLFFKQGYKLLITQGCSSSADYKYGKIEP